MKGGRACFGRACMLAAVLALPAGAAEATGQGNAALLKWKTMDTCAKQAQAAFPDFSPDSNAKREARLKDCLNANNLPPREPMTPPH
jgi:hypothetical protein